MFHMETHLYIWWYILIHLHPLFPSILSNFGGRFLNRVDTAQVWCALVEVNGIIKNMNSKTDLSQRRGIGINQE